MKIGPKYKIARRLGAPIFEKTQTQKFALREGNKKQKRGGRPKADFGLQLLEKQKARMFYAVSEKQFAKYVALSLEQTKVSPTVSLLALLENRLDNVVWRSGILPTHLSARQAVAHGHFLVNGKKSYTPSLNLKKGDRVSIREGSKESKLFAELETRLANIVPPNWLFLDPKTKEITIKDLPVKGSEALFDLGQVIEFYQR